MNNDNDYIVKKVNTVAQLPSKLNFIFSLIGDHIKSKLALNGEVVSIGLLSKKGFIIKPSPIKEGEDCLICAPKNSGILRKWVEVSITCNGIRGPVWVCTHCSKALVHKYRGKTLWEELLKTL